ncbi:MAG: ribonuclease HII [Coraliomargaritaceae bacterium]
MNALQTHDCSLLKERANHLIGVDEAGRGCLAGPVFAAACLIELNLFKDSQAVELTSEVNDSKQLSAQKRESVYAHLLLLRRSRLLHFAVAEASVAEIEALNVLGATRLAMQRAVEKIESQGDGWKLPPAETGGPLFTTESSSVCLLVDGRPLRPFPYAHEGVVKGDAKSLAIAAAGIAAKVERDRRMGELASNYPQFGFDRHKGYGTLVHREEIAKHGASPEHRRLFLRKILSERPESV